MKRIIILTLMMVMVLVFSMQAHASLYLTAQGTSEHGTHRLIYDGDLGITWYDYTMSSDTWQNQVDWAAGLSVFILGSVYDDWRLPESDSELGHLYYTELGNQQEDGGFTNAGDFQNLFAVNYWSGTEHIPGSKNASYFSFATGSQGYTDKDGRLHALAVREGCGVYGKCPPVAPEPISSTLFIIGGATLGFRRLRGWIS